MGVVSRIYCCNGGSGVIFVCLEVGSQVLQRFITRMIDSWPFVEDFATTIGLGLGLTKLLFATFAITTQGRSVQSDHSGHGRTGSSLANFQLLI